MQLQPFETTGKALVPSSTGVRSFRCAQTRRPAHNLLHFKITREVAMNWSSGLSWFKPLQGWQVKRFEEPDHADMGTAFGLDASMAPCDDDLIAAQIGAAQVPRPWEHRLTRRTGL